MSYNKPSNEMSDFESNPHQQMRNMVRNLSNKEIMKILREYHDSKLNQIDHLSGGMRDDAKLIGTELKTHNKLLSGLDKDMDNANKQMTKVDTKLKKLLLKTNT